MKKLQNYANKLGSRKFQVLLIGLCLFAWRPVMFTADHLVVIMCFYIGANIAKEALNKK